MATGLLTLSATEAGANSTWTGYQPSGNYIAYTTPTTDGQRIRVSVPAAMQGATFNSAVLTYTVATTSGGTKNVRYDGEGVTVTDSNILERLVSGGNLDLYFSFKATGGTGGVGSHTANCTWRNIQISVDYTPASAVSGTVSVGSSSVFYSVDKASLCGTESGKVSLAITPNVAVSAVTLYMGDSAHSTYDTFTESVQAPASQATSVSLTIAMNQVVLSSRVNTAYFKIELTTASGTQQSAWFSTSLKLITQRNAPVVSASWSDTAGYYATLSDYIQGFSHLNCAISVTLDTTADSEISIKSRSLSIKPQGTTTDKVVTSSTNAFDVGVLETSGVHTYSITVIDSHDQSTTITGSVSIHSYSAPKLTQLKMERYNISAGQVDDGSQNIRVTAIGTVEAINSKNEYVLRAAYDNGSTSGTQNMASGTDGGNINIVNSTSVFTVQLSETSNWTITVTLQDTLASASYTLEIPKAGGIFNIEKNGVSVGQRSTGTASSKKFECAYEAHFYNGVYGAGGRRVDGEDTGWVALTLSNCSEASGWGTCKSRVINNICYVRGTVTLSAALSSNTSRQLTELPVGHRPTQNMLTNSGARSNYSCIEIDADGKVILWNRTGSQMGTSEVISLTAAFPID